MNMLTWVIYLSDIVVNVQAVFISIFIAVGVYLTFRTISAGINNDIYDLGIPYPNWIKAGLFLVPLALITALIPSKETILLMAGSQFGEQVVKSPEAKELLGDIQEVIHNQLEQLKGDKK